MSQDTSQKDASHQDHGLVFPRSRNAADLRVRSARSISVLIALFSATVVLGAFFVGALPRPTSGDALSEGSSGSAEGGVGETSAQSLLAGPAMLMAPRTPSEQQVINAYKLTNRAVVYVSARTTMRDLWGVTAQDGSGSGVIIDEKEGLVLTNAHVIEGSAQVVITVASGQTFPVKILGRDPDIDLALLQIQSPPSDLTSVRFADSSKLEVGQQVLAIGNPFGLHRTLTIGIVSSLGRTIRAETGRMISDVIQTDAAINPGNSGGPLLDTAGRLIGLNTAIVSRTGENSGIGFAIPSNLVQQAIPQLMKYGRVLRPKIGVILEDTEYGAPVVEYVQPNGPAAEAGIAGARREIRLGGTVGVVRDLSTADFILGVNGKRVTSKLEVLDEISKGDADTEIVFTVKRGVGRGVVREVRLRAVLG